MIPCVHRLNVINRTEIDGQSIEVYACGRLQCCTVADFGLIRRDNSAMPVCSSLCQSRMAPTVAEPVGDALHELLNEIGAVLPACGECKAMRIRMNNWGVKGCQSRREEIIAHLKRKAGAVSLIQKAIIGLVHHYWSADSVLDEAISRASAE